MTLNKPLTRRGLKQKSWRCQGGSAGGGGGLFALLAMGGMICFVNYHAVVRPVRPTPAVNFRTATPTLPVLPRTHFSATRVRTTPAPARWIMPPPPPAPSQPPIVIEPQQAPIYWGPYGEQRGRGSGR